LAYRLVTRLVQEYGPSDEVSGDTYHAFPYPEALLAAGGGGLRGIGLSVRKAQYILDIAAKVISGELDLESLRIGESEEVIRILTAIKGVGMWTAQWLLIRGLGYSDGFPQGDIALERSLRTLIDDSKPLRSDELLVFSQRWSPFRSYVTTYIFAALRSGHLVDLLHNKEGHRLDG
jgi:DNA-3-methyladenine glycosylase II